MFKFRVLHRSKISTLLIIYIKNYILKTVFISSIMKLFFLRKYKFYRIAKDRTNNGLMFKTWLL